MFRTLHIIVGAIDLSFLKASKCTVQAHLTTQCSQNLPLVTSRWTSLSRAPPPVFYVVVLASQQFPAHNYMEGLTLTTSLLKHVDNFCY